MARRLTQRGTERRSQLMAYAAARFAEQGYHPTSVSEIVAGLGVGKGVFYWYFDSKDALFHALMDDQEAALRAHIDRTVGELSSGADGEALFRTSVRATFEFFESDRDVVRLLFQDSLVLGDRFDRHLAGLYEGFIADIEATIQAAQAAGYVIEAPPRMVAFSVAALVSQLALRRLQTDDGLTAEVVADFVVTLLLDGLRPRGGRPHRQPEGDQP